MSNYPLFIPKPGAVKNNCGECRLWDLEKQKCQKEEKLKDLGACK